MVHRYFKLLNSSIDLGTILIFDLKHDKFVMISWSIIYALSLVALNCDCRLRAYFDVYKPLLCIKLCIFHALKRSKNIFLLPFVFNWIRNVCKACRMLRFAIEKFMFQNPQFKDTFYTFSNVIPVHAVVRQPVLHSFFASNWQESVKLDFSWV